MVDDDPSNGQGFESALVYALAGQLGFSEEDVTWVRTGFDEAIAPGDKPYDFNVQQYSITEERAREVLGRLGLSEYAAEYPERMSGGQQQRAARRGHSALDPELVGEVLAVIRELADGGMTMILATHEMGFAQDVADRIYFMHEGAILESGPPSAVLSDPQQPRTRQFLQRLIDAGRL